MHGKENYMPHELGMTVEESIQKSPKHFYRHVVQHLLQTHEPEKVRLLDKLMLKYNAREEHLIQKLTLRYNRHTKEQNEKDTPTIAEDRSYNPNDQESTMDSVAINENKVMVDNSISSKSLRDVSFFSSTSVVKDQPMVETNIISKSSSSNGAFQEDKPQEAFEKEWPSPNNSNNDNDKLQQHEQLSQEDKSTAKMDLSNAKSIQKHHGETILDIAKAASNSTPPNPPIVETHNSQSEEGSSRDSSYSGGSSYSESSIDGTSPAVIAQVSELLNFVYGKTSVPGQIDRVSTIMRAYEGREAVLLELLETKALIKANSANDSETQQLPVTSPMSMSGPSTISVGESFMHAKGDMHDDISSVSGASSRMLKSPAAAAVETSKPDFKTASMPMHSFSPLSSPRRNDSDSVAPSQKETKPKEVQQPKSSKKKGIFNIFRGKKGRKNKGGGAFPSDDTSMSRRGTWKKAGGLLQRNDSEASI